MFAETAERWHSSPAVEIALYLILSVNDLLFKILGYLSAGSIS
jgi:hypothetical protein